MADSGMEKRKSDNGTSREEKLHPVSSYDPDFRPETCFTHHCSVISMRISVTLQSMYSERYGLTVVGWRLLAILGTHYPLSAKALSDISALDQVTISRALDQLAAKRFLVRRVDPLDRRRVLIRLSKKGERTYKEIVPLLYAAEQALVTRIAPDDLAIVRRAMAIMAAHSAEVLADTCDWNELLETYAGINTSEDIAPRREVPEKGDIPSGV